MASLVEIIVVAEDRASRALRGITGDLEGLGKVALGVAGGALAALGAGLVGVATTGVKAAADLEAQMDGVQAVLGATAEEMAALNDLTLQLGINPNLKVSTMEAAAAMEELAASGLTAEQILNGAAEATVLLANASGGDFALAATVATDAMSLFGIKAEEMIGAVDGIAAVANVSKFGIEDYALALANGGAVAASVGVEFEDFNTAIAAMAPAFTSGQTAGTSLKTLLTRLVPTSDNARDALRELGLVTADGANAFYDVNGQLKETSEVASLLHDAIQGLSEAEITELFTGAFGTEGMQAAFALAQSGAVIYTDMATAARELGISQEAANSAIEGGITKFEALQLQMGDASAIENAATRMDNFAGALDIAKGVVEGLSIQIGQALLPVLRPLVEQFAEFAAGPGQQFIETLSTTIEAMANAKDPIDALALGIAGVMTAFGADSQPITDTVKSFREFVDTAVVFVTEHKDAIIGALLGMAAAFALLSVIGTVTTLLGLLLSPVGLLILGAALLGAAWRTNWGGIQEKTKAVLDVVIPLLEGFWEVLRVTGPQALFILGWAFGKLREGAVRSILAISEAIQDLYEAIERVLDSLGRLSNQSTEYHQQRHLMGSDKGVGAPLPRMNAGEGPGMARGGSFVVPPGYPNDSFPVRVQSGERVTVTPRDEARASESEQPLTIQFNFNGPVSGKEEIEQALGRGADLIMSTIRSRGGRTA